MTSQALRRVRSLVAIFVGISLAELFLQSHQFSSSNDGLRQQKHSVLLRVVADHVESHMGRQLNWVTFGDSFHSVNERRNEHPWSDRSIYPWGLRVCSGVDRDRFSNATLPQATVSPIETFTTTNDCGLSPDAVEIIFAHIGPSLNGGEHLLDSIAITRRSNPCINIRLLLSKVAFMDNPNIRRVCECYGISVIFTENFDGDPLLRSLEDVFFVSGDMGSSINNKQFNLYTTSRLYYVRAFMDAFGVRHVIHLENDNPVYIDAANLGATYEACGIELGVPIRDESSYIWGFAYIQPKPLQRMLEHFIQRYKEGKQNLTKRLQSEWVNDMTLAADYAHANPGAITILPQDPDRSGRDCASLSENVYVDGASISVWNHGTRKIKSAKANVVRLGKGQLSFKASGSFGVKAQKVGPFEHTDGWGSYRGSFDPRPYDFGWKRQDDHRCSAPVLRRKEIDAKENITYMALANLHIQNKRVDRADPSCRRSKTYPFHTFGDLPEALRADMIRDLSLVNGLNSKSTQSGEAPSMEKRRASYPLITGDGFRSFCKNICDGVTCNFELNDLARGDCILLEDLDMENKAVTYLLNLFKAADLKALRPPYVLISHNTVYSYPTSKLSSEIVRYDFSDLLDSNLIFHWFTTNCNWKGSESGLPKPKKLSCIPIGVAKRQNEIGLHPERYFRAMEDIPLKRQKLLYISSGLGNVTMELEREKIGGHGVSIAENNTTWVTIARQEENWNGFAREVRDHKFVLCAMKGGLDTHLLWEILLLGSIPVVISSSLNNLYDGLPIVTLDRWADLTEDCLKNEWDRISNSGFELDRVFWPYWENRIREMIDKARSYFSEYKAEGEALVFASPKG